MLMEHNRRDTLIESINPNWYYLKSPQHNFCFPIQKERIQERKKLNPTWKGIGRGAGQHYWTYSQYAPILIKLKEVLFNYHTSSA